MDDKVKELLNLLQNSPAQCLTVVTMAYRQLINPNAFSSAISRLRVDLDKLNVMDPKLAKFVKENME